MRSDRALRVLVVEDCPDTRNSLTRLLSLWGHTVQSAPNGMAALQMVAAFRPDVVLLDLGLPGLDGYEVARRLRQREDIEQPLVVSLTGHGQPEDRSKALAAGCDLHWVKPAEPEALQQLLTESREGTLSTTSNAPAAERANDLLRDQRYSALHGITCTCHGGVLTLHGQVASYHLKQIAQATVAGIAGVRRLDNRIEVIRNSQKRDAGDDLA
jgi:two-component system OmpR family response regulator